MSAREKRFRDGGSHQLSHSPSWVRLALGRPVDCARRGFRASDRPWSLHGRYRRPPGHAACGVSALPARPCGHHLDRCVAGRCRRRGVVAVLHGEDIKALTSSLVVGVKAPVECWPMAVGRVRYVGEPVAVVVATDRYRAEDAVDLIDVRYAGAPCRRRSARGAEAGRAGASRRLWRQCRERPLASAMAIRKARLRRRRTGSASMSATPEIPARRSKPMAWSPTTIPSEDAYDVLANFQGPFSIHAVLSRALRVPGNRLRLRTPPDSGGSFGVKQGVFPYIVLIAAAARASGRPVKWIEDRLEHLTASVSATNRAISLSAAVARRRPHPRARLGSGRRLRRASAGAGARHALSHARQPHRRLRHPPHEGAQPRRRHQQDADRTKSRLWRSAGLFRAGAAGSAHRA